MKALFLAVLGLLFCRETRAAEAGLRLKQECGKGALAYLGYAPTDANLEKYRAKRAIIFDHNLVYINPEKPQVPGCFNLTAYNVQINRPLDTLVAEFYMTIGNHFDPTNDEAFKLPCRQKTDSKCQCGARDACMYCDFCDNFKEAIPPEALRGQTEVKVERKDWSAWDQSPEDQCKCGIQPGLYDIHAEICSPNRDELEKHFPPAIFAYADNNWAFTLWTTLYVYKGRFNDLNPHLPQWVLEKSLNSMKRALLGGCSVIGTDIQFT